MKILTPLQQDFLKAFSRTALKESFYFTGGTALSAFYLQHRLSEDMDFFGEEEGLVPRALPIIQEIAEQITSVLQVRRNFRSYLEFFLVRGAEILRCDFAIDSPFRLGEKEFRPEYGIYVDNVVDISCNKLSALYDRGEPKDFVDVFFIAREVLPFEQLVEKTKEKHIGLDYYWLAVSLQKIEELQVLPRMIKPINIAEMQSFFRQKARWLMQGK